MNRTMPPLSERYLQAVADATAADQRSEVTAEVRSALAEAVDAQVERGSSPQEAERAAVTELGDPAVLAARYTGSPLHLIGPSHYLPYRRLLRILLVIVVPIVAIVVLLAEAMSGSGPVTVLTTAGWAGLQTGIQLAFWVTLVFAVLERTGTQTGLDAWSPEDLPDVADRRIGLADTVLEVGSAVLLIVALVMSRTHWLVTGTDGTQVPVLDPDLWTLWAPVLIVVLLASMVLTVVVYRIGRWTVPLAALSTLLNAAFAGIVLVLWTSGQLLNPAMDLSGELAALIDLVPWVVLVISIAEVVQAWRGALRR